MSVQTNQVRNLYVVKNYVTDAKSVANEGDIALTVTKDGKKMYFTYCGANGNLMTSDYIDVTTAKAKAVAGDSLGRALKTASITLPEGKSGPVAGREYIVRVAISNYISQSDESIYTKYGVVASTSSMSASDFYKTLAISLARNFSREASKLFDIYLNDGSADTLVDLANLSALTGTYTSVKLVEAKQDYIRGTMPCVPVYFTVEADDIIENGEETQSLVVTYGVSTTKVPNGYEIADTEYFCMGERGDRLRMAGYPNIIHTKYLVDETASYDCLDINWSYIGNGIDNKASDKAILIVTPASGTALTTPMTTIVADLKKTITVA